VPRPLVADMRATCGLQPATLSKFEAGLLAAGLKVPGAPELGSTRIHPGSTVGDLAYAVLRKNLSAMLVHEPGTRLGEDVEELHDMRVATRRLRAALSLFSAALPVRAQHFREEIGWLGRELGAVRDLDVQLVRLEEWTADVPPEDRGALDGLAKLLEKEREAARSSLLSSLESPRYERLVSGITSMLLQGPSRRSSAARAPAVAVVPDLVSSRHSKVKKASRRAKRSRHTEDFHQLRISCKRLRYALEFVSDLYEGRTARMIKNVTRVQDSLGMMQDATVAVERLHTLATSEESALPSTTVFVMGGIAQRYRSEALRIRGSIAAHLKGLDGGVWRRLRESMERQRLTSAALYRWPLQQRPLVATETERAYEDTDTPIP
jgi:triphosphatase